MTPDELHALKTEDFPTPETDAIAKRQAEILQDPNNERTSADLFGSFSIQWQKHARKLEQERDRARIDLAAAEGTIAGLKFFADAAGKTARTALDALQATPND